MLLVIVYVGAVAVLFLFVVMMLDVDFAELRAGLSKMRRWGCGGGYRARRTRGALHFGVLRAALPTSMPVCACGVLKR